MLRSLPRAAPSSTSMRCPSIRAALRNPRTTLPLCTSDAKKQQKRSVAAHAISNPTLSQIEKRWESMPPQDQADLWMALRDRMKNDWHELTLQERKAGTCAWSSFVTVTSDSISSACVFLCHISNAKLEPRKRLYTRPLFLLHYSSNTNLKCSILDSLRSSRSSRSPSAWRELVCLPNDNARHWRFLPSLLRHTVTSGTSAENDECPIPRNDQ